MNVIKYLEKNVEKHPTKISIIYKDQQLTFQELYDKISIFSSTLGFLKSDVVSLISENSINFVIAYLGILKAGKVAHISHPEITEKKLQEQLESANSGAIICSKIVKEKISRFDIKIQVMEIEELQKKTDTVITNQNKIAYIIYTSGTTSIPKGVPISHEMIDFTTNNITKILEYTEHDIDVLPLPLHHSFGLGCLHTSLLSGSTLVLLDNANNLELILDSIKKYNATTLAAIPATLTKFLSNEKTELKNYFKNIRLIITNSTSIPRNTVLEFKKKLENGKLATYYGLTEASRSTFMIFEKDNGRENSVGKKAPGVEIKIINEEKDESEIGEIWIKGKNVIKKYWNNENADENIVDGWIKTGDAGYLDAEQYLFLVGRNDDIINVGGEKILPQEVESVIREIPGVAEVVIFGIKHEVYGQIIKANIVKTKNSDLDKTDILKYCINNLERFKIPSKIEFVEDIPKTDYGKVKRFILK